MTYWGQDSHHDSQGFPLQRWEVRKSVDFGDGAWYVTPYRSGAAYPFRTFGEALEWATSLAVRVEYWLAQR